MHDFFHTLSLHNLLLLTLSHYHLIIFPLLLLHFLVFSSCCFVPVPVAVQMEVLNTSMAPLKTYPLCGFTRHSVSGLPVSDSYPPVITIITYGCAIPSPFIKLVFLCKCEWQTFLFFQLMSIFIGIYANAYLVGVLAYIIVQFYSWYLLNLFWPYEWPCTRTCTLACEISDM